MRAPCFTASLPAGVAVGFRRSSRGPVHRAGRPEITSTITCGGLAGDRHRRTHVRSSRQRGVDWTAENDKYPTPPGDGIAGARAIAKLRPIDPATSGIGGRARADGSPPSSKPRSARRFRHLRLRAAGHARGADGVCHVESPNRPRLPKSDVDAMLAARKAWTGHLAERSRALRQSPRSPPSKTNRGST